MRARCLLRQRWATWARRSCEKRETRPVVDLLPLLPFLRVSTIVLTRKDAEVWSILLVNSLDSIISRASLGEEGLRTSTWVSRSTWGVRLPSRCSPGHWHLKQAPAFSTKREPWSGSRTR